MTDLAKGPINGIDATNDLKLTARDQSFAGTLRAPVEEPLVDRNTRTAPVKRADWRVSRQDVAGTNLAPDRSTKHSRP